MRRCPRGQIAAKTKAILGFAAISPSLHRVVGGREDNRNCQSEASAREGGLVNHAFWCQGEESGSDQQGFRDVTFTIMIRL